MDVDATASATADVKARFLSDLHDRFPSLRKLSGSRSMYEDPASSARIYVRYSKLHNGQSTFYGLRDVDLRCLQGHPAVICLLWDGQASPLVIPFSAFEDVFSSVKPAPDGQFKVQVYVDPTSTELYIPGAGRFNVEGYIGWNELNRQVPADTSEAARNLSHAQVQTLLGAIGHAKNNDVWLPMSDRGSLDSRITRAFPIHDSLPPAYAGIHRILSEIDVVWLKRGAGEIVALFEVEHTTSVYSGLLRFNDVHLVAPQLRPRFSIVASDARRVLYMRQINRPTFQMSGLADQCTFMEYGNVIDWHRRIVEAR